MICCDIGMQWCSPFHNTLSILFLCLQGGYLTVIKDETAVFLIHVDVYPFKEVWENDNGLIKQAIDSMSENVLEYKNLIKVRELIHEHILST